MKAYQKRMKDYKELIQEEYVREASVQRVIDCCSDVMLKKENLRISYFEFLYGQSRFIKKRWWALQGVVLFLLWLLLKDSNDAGDMGRMLGILATVFVILIIPEVWKNQRYSAMEIEGAAFYSLRQICAARLFLFAAVDLVMVTVFFAVSFYTVKLPAYRMIVDFLIPLHVSGCICFRMLCGRKSEMEYAALLASGIWMVVWSAVVLHDEVYHKIAEPVWTALLLLSFGYFVFCIKKSQIGCESSWEGYIRWN